MENGGGLHDFRSSLYSETGLNSVCRSRASGHSLRAEPHAAAQVSKAERPRCRQAGSNICLIKFPLRCQVGRQWIAGRKRLDDTFREDSHLRLRNKWHRHCPLKYPSKPELDSNRTGQDEDAFAKDARDPPDSFAQQEFLSAHNANCLATSSRNFQAAVHETLR